MHAWDTTFATDTAEFISLYYLDFGDVDEYLLPLLTKTWIKVLLKERKKINPLFFNDLFNFNIQNSEHFKCRIIILFTSASSQNIFSCTHECNDTILNEVYG